MANFFQKLFGGGKKQEATNVYFPSQDPRFQLAQKSLEDIIAKRGYYTEPEMGYTKSFLDTNTAPYATARRENFKNYEIPNISAQASARGLGRSTIPVNRIALSGQEAERDIEQRIAQLTEKSEDLKAQQKSQNLNAYLSAISGIAGLSDKEVVQQNQAREYAAKATEANRLQDIKTTQGATLAGLQMAGPILGLIPGVGPALSGVTQLAAGGIGQAAGMGTGAAPAGNAGLLNKSDGDLQQILKDLLSKLVGGGKGSSSQQYGSSGAGQMTI